jgi:hypothetical protein
MNWSICNYTYRVVSTLLEKNRKKLKAGIGLIYNSPAYPFSIGGSYSLKIPLANLVSGNTHHYLTSGLHFKYNFENASCALNYSNNSATNKSTFRYGMEFNLDQERFIDLNFINLEKVSMHLRQKGIKLKIEDKVASISLCAFFSLDVVKRDLTSGVMFNLDLD